MFSRSSQNYIITARIVQGQRDLKDATFEERNDIVTRWQAGDFDLKGFQSLKKRERTAQKAPASPNQAPQPDSKTESRSNGSSWQSRLTSFDGRARLNARKDDLLRGFGNSASSSSTAARQNAAEDAEFEKAIQASVQETSRGNADEDAMVEAAIRQSVNAVRKQGSLPDPVRSGGEKNPRDPDIFDDADYQITDEEYQALVEQAIQQSLAGESIGGLPQQVQGISELDAVDSKRAGIGGAHAAKPTADSHDDNDSLRRAIEDSKNAPSLPDRTASEDDELQRAIAASKEYMEREKNQQTEEDVVLEYIKKQSLAEEEYRKKHGASQGKDPALGGGDDQDEDFKRALEESLKTSQGDASGPSHIRD